MARPKRDWTDQARLILWREEVYARTACDSYHHADKFLGLATDDPSDRPRIFERIFNRDQFPSDEHIELIASVPGFETTAELISSSMWKLLKEPPNSVLELDGVMQEVMSNERLCYPNELEWMERLERFRSKGISEPRGYSIVVENVAKAVFTTDFSRLAYLLLNLYRAQIHRQIPIMDEMIKTVDTALDNFFHHWYEYHQGREFYQLAVNRAVGRKLSDFDICGLYCSFFVPPMLIAAPAKTNE